MSPLSPAFKALSSPSKSFAAALACFSLGVTAASFLPVPGTGTVDVRYPVLAVAFFGAMAWVGLRGRRMGLAALFVACFALGIWRYGQVTIAPTGLTIADAAGESARITGTVVSEVERHASGFRAVIGDMRVAGEPVEGKLLAWLPDAPEVAYGDTLSFECAPSLPEPIESFRYDRYLRSRGILAVCFRPGNLEVLPSDGNVVGTLLAVKRVVGDRLASVVPEPHASFLSGLLFGGSSSLSQDIRDDFASTGTSHILAASGFNVSLFTLVFLTWVTHTTLGRRRGAFATAALLAAYVAAAGATAAVVRAALMGAVTLAGFVTRRKPSVLNMLLLALAAMLAWNPLLLRDDVGFQLSFVATAAMLLFAPRVEERCWFVPERLGLRASFAASLAAIVATLPILLWHFGSASLTAPVVNLIVLPLVPLAMSLTAIAIVAAFVHPALGSIAALPAWAVSSVVMHVIGWFGAWTS